MGGPFLTPNGIITHTTDTQMSSSTGLLKLVASNLIVLLDNGSIIKIQYVP
jgi:hypothetical protein